MPDLNVPDPNRPNDPRASQVPPVPPALSAFPPAAGFPPAAHLTYQDTPPQFGATSFINDTTTVEDRIEQGPSVVGRVGLVAAALAIAGGGAFAVTRALAEPVGAQTPEEAVVQLFEAVENDDLVGLTESMLPSEREAIIDPMIDLFSELDRLELLDGDFDLEARTDEAGSDGLDFSVRGLDFTTTAIGDGVVNARLNAGIVTVRGDVSDLPFGDRADSELGSEALSKSIDQEILDFSAEEDARFTLVEEDGTWYVSLWYSVAEAARADAGEPAPNFGAGVTPAGGDSPEAAVRLMMERAVDLDAGGVIASLDPSEFRALYDYAPLFLDDADAGAAEARQAAASEGISWSLDRLDLSSGDLRGRTVVRIEGFAFSAGADGQSISVDFDGNCVTTVVDREIDEICLDEISDQLGDIDLPQAYVDFVNEYTSGITVVERDGAWFVSGVPTMIGAYTDLLASLDPQDIDDFTSFFQDSLEGAFDLSDPFFGTSNDLFEFQPIDDEPFFDEQPFDEQPFEEDDDYDPFAEDEPVFDEEPPELSADDFAVYLPRLEVTANDPEYAYFAGETGLAALAYGYAYDVDGNSVEVVRFAASAEELNAAMADSFSYELVQVEGLPEGATAYDWPEVDRAIVVDNFIVSAYFNEDETSMQLLLEQVTFIAKR